jgi:hypothetical protein
MNDVAAPATSAPDGEEIATLARELSSRYRSLVTYYKETCGLSAQEAVARTEAPAGPEYVQQIMQGPADEVSWDGLEYVLRTDPAQALQIWEWIKREARNELRSGHRAAKAVESYTSCTWERAEFMALRLDLVDAWQPRNGVERQLIDTMALAQTLMLQWSKKLSLYSTCDMVEREKEFGQPCWIPPNVSQAQATEQAAAMVDRFNRILLRTLRALRDLRRYTPAVIVRNAGQVNVGGQQVNVAAPAPVEG